MGDPPSESHSAKHHSSRHSTGGSVRMSTNGTPSSGGHKNSVSEQGANSRAASGAAKEGSSKRSRKHHSSTQVSMHRIHYTCSSVASLHYSGQQWTDSGLVVAS